MNHERLIGDMGFVPGEFYLIYIIFITLILNISYI